MLFRSVLRTVRKSIGRYLTIFAIIALGVGFFAGLRVTQEAMIRTADEYVRELRFYDYRLVSTLGFTGEDVRAFHDLAGVEAAAGSVSSDCIVKSRDGADKVLHAHTLTDGINLPDVRAGRLPQAADECVLDAKYADESMLGTTLRLSENNPDPVADLFAYDAYTVVGIVNSPVYLNFERGTSTLGDGSAVGYLYLLPEGVSCAYYTEVYLTLPASGEIYSDAYADATDAVRDSVETLLAERAELRYQGIYGEAKAELDEKQAQVDAMRALYGDIPPVVAAQEELNRAAEELNAMPRATVYALDRSSNIGYASLESDTSIVSGVAKVFPLFFFLVAALVCITTMTRMVGEQRTENGVLKALGFGEAAITGQYLFYAGSASVLGCAAGFLVGSRFMPMALWQVYRIMYSIERPVAFVLDLGLFAVCSLAYLFVAMGITWYVCHRDLRETSAELIRPKAPSAGKRVFLERVGFLWRRIPFLHKVSIRNILRYKKRMLMMVVGIGGCTALLITGFGIRDSIQPLADYQFNEINTYDAAIGFLETAEGDKRLAFEEETAQVTDGVAYLHTESGYADGKNGQKPINLVVFDTPPEGFVNLHDGDTPIAFPGAGEAVINYRFAKDNGIDLGDTITVFDSEYRQLHVRVTGIFDNYIYDYVYLSAATFEEQWGTAPGYNSAFVRFADGKDAHEAGAVLLDAENVASVTLSEDLKTRIGSMLDSMNYIVLIVLVCAGALAFIVLYNLTNIAIIERMREIATLKVLGFTLGEQNSYVFRENLILTALGALCGIPLGIALLHYVMAQIKISTIYFASEIAPLSFLFSILLTFFFTVVVDLALTAKIRKINMAEAMKAVE